MTDIKDGEFILCDDDARFCGFLATDPEIYCVKIGVNIYAVNEDDYKNKFTRWGTIFGSIEEEIITTKIIMGHIANLDERLSKIELRMALEEPKKKRSFWKRLKGFFHRE